MHGVVLRLVHEEPGRLDHDQRGIVDHPLDVAEQLLRQHHVVVGDTHDHLAARLMQGRQDVGIGAEVPQLARDAHPGVLGRVPRQDVRRLIGRAIVGDDEFVVDPGRIERAQVMGQVATQVACAVVGRQAKAEERRGWRARHFHRPSAQPSRPGPAR
jgi:hypothetical protein